MSKVRYATCRFGSKKQIATAHFLYKMMTDSPYYPCSNMGKGVKMENNTKNKTTNNATKAQKATTKNTANVKNKTANTKNCGKGCDCKER